MLNTKIKKLFLVLFTIVFFASGYLYYIYANSFNYNDNIKLYNEVNVYKSLLKKEPHNCLYMQQIAAKYSFMNKYDEAISYYKDVIKYCPDDHFSIYQLSICYLLNGKKEMALESIDMAIKKAEALDEKDFALGYKNDRASVVRPTLLYIY